MSLDNVTVELTELVATHAPSVEGTLEELTRGSAAAAIGFDDDEVYEALDDGEVPLAGFAAYVAGRGIVALADEGVIDADEAFLSSRTLWSAGWLSCAIMESWQGEAAPEDLEALCDRWREAASECAGDDVLYMVDDAVKRSADHLAEVLGHYR